MTRIVYYTATTLDGFLADPEDSLDWLLRQPLDERGPNDYDAFFAGIGALVMGATTYEWILRHESGAWPYRIPAWVMTHRRLPLPRPAPGSGPGAGAAGDGASGAADGAPGAGARGTAGGPADAGAAARPDIRFARGPVAEVVAELRAAAGDRDLWVVGGGDLAGQFADAGLLDEVATSIAPVVLGAGRPLLPRRLDLELIETGRNGAFVTARHRVVGPLREDRPD